MLGIPSHLVAWTGPNGPTQIPAEPAFYQRAKNRLVPRGPRPWRLRVGIGRGLTIILDLEYWTRLYLGLYELELNRYLRHLCRPGYRCFDVGGQNGYDALVLAKLTRGNVITFECVPELCNQIAESVRANPRLKHLVTVRNAFVGRNTDPSALQLALDDIAYHGDGFVPDFVKMDIEGGELEALLGAERILADRRPSMIVEVHSRELEDHCGRLLRKVGYEPKVVNPRRWLRDNRPTGHNRWLVAEGLTPPTQPEVIQHPGAGRSGS